MTDVEVTAAETTRIASWKLLLRNPMTVTSAIALVLIAFVAVTANWIAPFGVNDVDVPNALRPPAVSIGSAPTNSAAMSSPAFWSRCRRR